MLASSTCPRQCKAERLPAEKCAAEDSRQFQKADFLMIYPPSSRLLRYFLLQMTSALLSPRFLDQHRYSWNIRIADLSKLSSKTAGMMTGARGSGGRTSNCCRALPQWPCTAPWAAVVVVLDWSAGLRFLPPPSTPRRDKDGGEPWTPETLCPDSEDESTSEVLLADTSEFQTDLESSWLALHSIEETLQQLERISDRRAGILGTMLSRGAVLPEASEVQVPQSSKESGTNALDPCDPPRLLLPSLLEYLTVDDIMEWRRTSQQTRRPRVFIQHLTEMGRLDRSESILDFSAKWKRNEAAVKDPRDVTERKFFECRWWCMRLAKARHYTQLFPESDVVVQANLRDLLVHCNDVDDSVRWSAHHLIQNHVGLGSHASVQRLIAEAMLGLMADRLPETAEICKENSYQVLRCSLPLPWVVRALTKSQRQKWVSLLVRLLDPKSYQSTVIEHLTLLWRADDDPRRSYAEADRQLQALSQHSGRDVKEALFKLRMC
ncbi:unnamed protein product [Symbiodinium sp. CCMP2592]|nr:unnamed protein product [Symbiodinium sp. CCMP2592]